MRRLSSTQGSGSFRALRRFLAAALAFTSVAILKYAPYSLPSDIQRSLDNFVTSGSNASLDASNVRNTNPNCSPRLRREPTNNACDGFNGIILIQSGDRGAAAGTVFFQYIVNQLIFADMHNLLPWIHLNNVSSNIYDSKAHGGANTTIRATEKLGLKWIQNNEHEQDWGAYPSPFEMQGLSDAPKEFTVSGNGVWECYFEPVSNFAKHDASCENKPLVTLDYDHLNPGLQFWTSWAVRSWPYAFISPPFRPSDDTIHPPDLHSWYEPMRVRAHAIVTKHYRFLPHIVQRADAILPENTECLAVHIRHTDKAGLARRRIHLSEFEPYIMAFQEATNGSGIIYIATDSSEVMNIVQSNWDADIRRRIRTQEGVLRSAKFKPVFRIGDHHRTNTEVLVDILVMSRCRFFVHGFSAVSESTMYINIDLHNRSVDLEDPNHMTAEAFGALVETDLRSKE